MKGRSNENPKLKFSVFKDFSKITMRVNTAKTKNKYNKNKLNPKQIEATIINLE
jgi:hypothetical protein